MGTGDTLLRSLHTNTSSKSNIRKFGIVVKVLDCKSGDLSSIPAASQTFNLSVS